MFLELENKTIINVDEVCRISGDGHLGLRDGSQMHVKAGDIRRIVEAKCPDIKFLPMTDTEIADAVQRAMQSGHPLIQTIEERLAPGPSDHHHFNIVNALTDLPGKKA